MSEVKTSTPTAGDRVRRAVPARPSLMGRLRRVVEGGPGGYVLSFGLAILAWFLATLVLNVPSYILPSPLEVVGDIVKYSATLWEETLVTTREILIGFALAVVIGVLLGTIMTFSKVVHNLIYPIFVALNAIPKVALAPLLVIWFGYGGVTNAVVAFSLAVFPVVINVSAGLLAIEPEMVNLGRIMGGNRNRNFRMIRVPIAAPYFFAGFKLAMANATVGAVVGEFVASSAGLGYISQQAAGTLNTSLAFAALIILSAVGIILFGLVGLVERLVIRH